MIRFYFLKILFFITKLSLGDLKSYLKKEFISPLTKLFFSKFSYFMIFMILFFELIKRFSNFLFKNSNFKIEENLNYVKNTVYNKILVFFLSFFLLGRAIIVSIILINFNIKTFFSYILGFTKSYKKITDFPSLFSKHFPCFSPFSFRSPLIILHFNNIQFKEEEIVYLEDLQKRILLYMSKLDSSHDELHIKRVIKNAFKLYFSENLYLTKEDFLSLYFGALFHDINDFKYENVSPFDIETAIKDSGLDVDLEELSTRVLKIVENVSWRRELSHTKEEINKIISSDHVIGYVQDADRLDSLGAEGIARTFAYGNRYNVKFYASDELEKKFISFYAKDSPADYMNRKTTENTFFFMTSRLSCVPNKMKTTIGFCYSVYQAQYITEFLFKIHRNQVSKAYNTGLGFSNDSILVILSSLTNIIKNILMLEIFILLKFIFL